MPDIYFTSDLHLGHALVSHLRGHGDSRETADTNSHDEQIAQGWTETVSDGDQVWILGDLTGHPRKYPAAFELLRRLPGSKHLIAGNHDAVSPVFRDAYKHMAAFMDVFDSVAAYARRRIDGHEVFLSHYPYPGDGADHTEALRYLQHRLPDMGAPLLHGHTHNHTQRLHYSGEGTPQVHVGVDAWGFKPVPLGEVASLLRVA